MYIKSLKGLGDNIYQRAFVKALKKPVYIQTPWPELYRDIPDVHFVYDDTVLRTQKKNVIQQDQSIWVNTPNIPPTQIIYYKKNIVEGMRECFGIDHVEFDLPVTKPCLSHLTANKKIALLRPVTLRKEWKAGARNPDPDYLYKASCILRDHGYFIISVADLAIGEEWLIGEKPVADVEFNYGELFVDNLLHLVQKADIVVGGIGWIVPAGIAAKVKTYVICGGGCYNHPSYLIGGGADLKKIRFEIPDDYCMCVDMNHACNKVITGFGDKFNNWLGDCDE